LEANGVPGNRAEAASSDLPGLRSRIRLDLDGRRLLGGDVILILQLSDKS
jgi:hypothetical protein